MGPDRGGDRRSNRRTCLPRHRRRSRRRGVPRNATRHRLPHAHARGTRERPEERDPVWTLEQILSSPNIAAKTWVHRQYDTTVRTNTVVGPGGDAAVVRVRGTERALALKTDCNGRYVYLDPRVGTQLAVCEAARNVAC